jgi:PPK2 family polyphosphate:nucleotide phosphotransferase
MRLAELLRVKPGSRVSLKSVKTDGTPGLSGSKDAEKSAAQRQTAKNVERMAELQECLYAENKRGLLIVLQGMDTSGKDGVVRHVFSGLNPQGCHVTSFKKPSEEESDHDFLWRIYQAVPARGDIAVFNRAHYEDVLIVRVHNYVPESVWSKRFKMINDFEDYHRQNGVTILKFFLHISKAEQLERLKARVEDPSKRWKFNPGDLEERKFWATYQKAYEDALSKCSTPGAPWYIIPADRKWYRDFAISTIIRESMESMKPTPPAITYDPSKIKFE